MKLLTPQEQKDVENEEEARQKNTLVGLTDAVNKAVKLLNEFKERDKAERQQITEDHVKFTEKLDFERANLEEKVNALESRRTEAMRPLDVIKQSLNARENELDTRNLRLTDWERSLAVKEREVSELAGKNKERLGELNDFRLELNGREEKINEEKRFFEISMRYKDSVIRNERARLREYFEEESRKIK